MSIARLFVPLALLTSAAACTQEIPEMQAVAVVPANTLSLTGAVTYDARIGLSADSRLRLTLHDLSSTDIDGSIVAEDIIALDGNQIPISFEFEPQSAKFMQLKKYGLRAAIIDTDEAKLWATETAYLINPFAGGQDVGDLTVVRVQPRPSERAAPIKPGKLTYVCGQDEDVLSVDISEERADVTFEDKSYDLPRVVSASGAKYETGARGDRVMFWSKGDEAVWATGLSSSLTCARILPADKAVGAPILTGKAWKVVKFRDEPFVQGVKQTLTFKDGRVSGSAGCNSYFADYEVSDLTIKFGQVGLTKKMCPPEIMGQEALFSKFLASAESFKIDDDGSLIIKSSVGHKLTAQR